MNDEARNDSVSIAFDLMRIELDAEAENLNSEGASAFRDGEYGKASDLSTRGLTLKDFSDRVQELGKEWKEVFAKDFPEMPVAEPVKEVHWEILSSSKAAKTLLIVKFPDGKTIYEPKAAETFAATIEAIGLQRVSELGLKVNKEDLVSKIPTQFYSDVKRGKYFIKTHSSTKAKKRKLEEIAELLGLKLEVGIVDP